MSTQAQIEANQANAQFSTGPVTPEGKSASAQNSTKHGLTATYPVIRTSAEQHAFDELTDSFQSELRPITPSDQIIFKNLIHAAWNIDRCHRLEAEIAESSLWAQVPSSSMPINLFWDITQNRLKTVERVQIRFYR